jgi:membrane-associated protease RseP (regulator of RpoE activity)
MVLALFTARLPADTPNPKQPKPVTVPFELLRSGHMAVQVKANGKGPFKLIFDTGAPLSLVNNKLAKEAGLLKDMPAPALPIFGMMGETKIKTLEVGDAKEHNIPTIVMDHPTVEQISKVLGTPIYGIVGFPFFARFKITIDYKAKTLTLAPSTYRPPDVMKALNNVLAGMLFNTTVPARSVAPAAQWGVSASKRAGDDEAGVDVKSVVAGSAADKAGLKAGDRLLTLDGRWTDSMEDLYDAAGYVKAGTTVVVRIKRGGKEMDLTVTPASGM